jgi:nitrate reductase assembly molybdenum cofactor insertion protein NarJ
MLTLSWSYAQKNLKKSDVHSKYKLVLNLTDVIESENDDMDLLEEIIVTSITSPINRLSNDYVNVTFDFRNNNSLLVKTKEKDETRMNGISLIRI